MFFVHLDVLNVHLGLFSLHLIRSAALVAQPVNMQKPLANVQIALPEHIAQRLMARYLRLVWIVKKVLILG